MKKVNINVLEQEERKRFSFAGNEDIIIYHMDKETMEDIIALQELYYIDNKSEIPDRVLMLEILKRVSNLDINTENELVIQDLLKNPKNIWMRLVMEELKSMIIEVNELKLQTAKNEIAVLNQTIKNIEDGVKIAPETKEYFKRNQDMLLKTDNKILLDSLQDLGLIEVNITDDKEEEKEEDKDDIIKRLLEENRKLKGDKDA